MTPTEYHPHVVTSHDAHTYVVSESGWAWTQAERHAAMALENTGHSQYIHAHGPEGSCHAENYRECIALHPAVVTQ